MSAEVEQVQVVLKCAGHKNPVKQTFNVNTTIRELKAFACSSFGITTQVKLPLKPRTKGEKLSDDSLLSAIKYSAKRQVIKAIVIATAKERIAEMQGNEARSVLANEEEENYEAIQEDHLDRLKAVIDQQYHDLYSYQNASSASESQLLYKKLSHACLVGDFQYLTTCWGTGIDDPTLDINALIIHAIGGGSLPIVQELGRRKEIMIENDEAKIQREFALDRAEQKRAETQARIEAEAAVASEKSDRQNDQDNDNTGHDDDTKADEKKGRTVPRTVPRRAPLFPPEAVQQACRFGRYKILHWLRSIGTPISRSHATCAIINGHFRCFRLIVSLSESFRTNFCLEFCDLHRLSSQGYIRSMKFCIANGTPIRLKDLNAIVNSRSELESVERRVLEYLLSDYVLTLGHSGEDEEYKQNPYRAMASGPASSLGSSPSSSSSSSSSSRYGAGARLLARQNRGKIEILPRIYLNSFIHPNIEALQNGGSNDYDYDHYANEYRSKPQHRHKEEMTRILGNLLRTACSSNNLFAATLILRQAFKNNYFFPYPILNECLQVAVGMATTDFLRLFLESGFSQLETFQKLFRVRCRVAREIIEQTGNALISASDSYSTSSSSSSSSSSTTTTATTTTTALSLRPLTMPSSSASSSTTSISLPDAERSNGVDATDQKSDSKNDENSVPENHDLDHHDREKAADDDQDEEDTELKQALDLIDQILLRPGYIVTKPAASRSTASVDIAAGADLDDQKIADDTDFSSQDRNTFEIYDQNTGENFDDSKEVLSALSTLIETYGSENVLLLEKFLDVYSEGLRELESRQPGSGTVAFNARNLIFAGYPLGCDISRYLPDLGAFLQNIPPGAATEILHDNSFQDNMIKHLGFIAACGAAVKAGLNRGRDQGTPILPDLAGMMARMGVGGVPALRDRFAAGGYGYRPFGVRAYDQQENDPTPAGQMTEHFIEDQDDKKGHYLSDLKSNRSAHANGNDLMSVEEECMRVVDPCDLLERALQSHNSSNIDYLLAAGVPTRLSLLEKDPRYKQLLIDALTGRLQKEEATNFAATKMIDTMADVVKFPVDVNRLIMAYLTGSEGRRAAQAKAELKKVVDSILEANRKKQEELKQLEENDHDQVNDATDGKYSQLRRRLAYLSSQIVLAVDMHGSP